MVYGASGVRNVMSSQEGQQAQTVIGKGCPPFLAPLVDANGKIRGCVSISVEMEKDVKLG
jgi:hypothetical protein